jgi:hypothetical protein
MLGILSHLAPRVTATSAKVKGDSFTLKRSRVGSVTMQSREPQPEQIKTWVAIDRVHKGFRVPRD